MAARKRELTPTQRWTITESDKTAISEGCYFDQEAADHVCNFFENYLCHTVGRFAGKRFTLLSWQRNYLSRLYGWKRSDGLRRFRETYLEIPKKNGKSSLFAGIALYGLFEEAAAEVFLGAVNRKQAKIIFNECARMIAWSPELKKRLKVIKSRNTVVFSVLDSKIETMSADVSGQDGANATLCILDECHRFKKPDLYEVMQYAGAAREQPLLVNITTAGFDRQSLCYRLHKRALAQCNGSPGDTDFLGVIYGVPEGTDDELLDDPEVWKAVNPSLGEDASSILKMTDFRKDFDKAKKIPREWNNFKRLRLNIWTESAVQWLNVNQWDEADQKNYPDEFPFDPVGRECVVAMDLSSVKDLTAATFAYKDDDDIIRTKQVFFCPADTATERAELDGQPYPEWIESGEIIATGGRAVDYDVIRKYLNDRVDDGWDIIKVGCDPWNAQQLMTNLEGDGFEVVSFSQTFRALSGPCKELEKRLLDGTIRHTGNKVMRWCVVNCSTETDAEGNIKPSKKKSTERIDGVPATVMAIGLLVRPADVEAGIVVVKKDQ